MSDGDGDVVRGDRFSGGPARGFVSSLEADRRIFEADLAVDRAHVVMLAEVGIVPEGAAGRILAALDAVESAGYDDLHGEDVHAAIETAVIDAVGPEGGWLHTARSRNDEVATCIRYRLREDLLGAMDAVVAFREALLAVAAEHGRTVMPGYTHLQPAQPTTVAHWALSYAGALERDHGRLRAALDRTDRSPLGGCALAGTGHPIDRGRTADLLGFDGLVENAMDAVASRDFLIETAAALATTASTAAGLAEDVVVFANRGFVDLDDRYASTSSIMPQKKNPDTLELVRATAGDATGALAAVATTVKGLPRAYNRDLQRATPPVWSSVDAVTEAVEVAAGAVETARWDADRLHAAAGEGFATATDLADRLTRAGVPFRTAHRLVAEVAEGGVDTDDPAGVLRALREAAADALDDGLPPAVDRAAVAEALDPVTSVETRTSRGGTASPAVTRQREGFVRRLERDREWVAGRRERLAGAADDLEAAAASLRA